MNAVFFLEASRSSSSPSSPSSGPRPCAWRSRPRSPPGCGDSGGTSLEHRDREEGYQEEEAEVHRVEARGVQPGFLAVHGAVRLPEDVLATEHADDAEDGGDGMNAARLSASGGRDRASAHRRSRRSRSARALAHHREEDEVRVEGQPSGLRIRRNASDEGDDADRPPRGRPGRALGKSARVGARLRLQQFTINLLTVEVADVVDDVPASVRRIRR